MSAGHPPPSIPGARLLFSLDPAVSYLNHGAFGAVPMAVQRAQQRLRDEAESNPVRFYAQGLLDRVVHTRRHIASFLGADPDGTALVPNTTAAVAVVLQSVRLDPGDEILLTDHVYGAVSLAVGQRCRRAGATVRTISLPIGGTTDEIVSRVRDALRPGRTKLLVVDHIASATAQVQPVAQISAAARAVDVPVLVDGAHVPGMLPVQIDAIGADFWVGNLHKWAYAPGGTAVLSVTPSRRQGIEPLAVSWEQEAGFPRSVEFQGTLDHSTWLAAPVGLHVLRTVGCETVREHNAALAAYGQRVVGEALDVAPADRPDPGDPAAAMRVLPLPPGLASTMVEAQDLRRRIGDKLATEVAVNAWAGRGWLRLSAQIYNSARDYDRLAERLPALLAASR